MNWLDRLLLVIEVLILLKMLKMDMANSQAIQKFLKERELWYARRAHLRTSLTTTADASESALENEKTPEVNLGSSELVTVLQETENEQNEAR